MLVFCAVCIALAFATGQIKLFHLPMGGSVRAFSMFFTCLAGYLFGPIPGLVSGLAQGALNFFMSPDEIVSPIQVACDYFFAYAALGLSGFFWKMRAGVRISFGHTDEKGDFKSRWGITFSGLEIGYLVGVTGRYIFAVISGVAFYAAYAPEGMNPLAYSMAYNAIYIYAEAAITIILLSLPPVRRGIALIKHMAE
ncbi:MAG: energy-coupled thiamine transporter ThiT [Lachnospiraceae bacterium]|nr:energy-coupled thiamine transporter ThiT [Lachnospiraceae bacterium]